LGVVGRRDRTEDAESFTWFFAAEYPAVVRSLCQLVGRHDAEDLAQEAFVRLHQRWARISRYERPDAWVRRVAINLAITHARRERRRGDRETRAERMTPELAETPEPDSRVVDALRALSPRDQALVVLFYFEDRPVSEAAEILEMSVGAAKVALHRARARLAQLLQVEVHDEPR
jgi:RNA polymerase sigma-70 factor (ECF subfamily)